MTNPKALIATATAETLNDTYYEMLTEVEAKGTVLYCEVRGLQITILYQGIEVAPKPPKTPKKGTMKSLNQKAQALFLSDLMVERRDEKICIVDQYSNRLIASYNTPSGVSRKLTAIHWERQIKMLKIHGLITQ